MLDNKKKCVHNFIVTNLKTQFLCQKNKNIVQVKDTYLMDILKDIVVYLSPAELNLLKLNIPYTHISC